jgi:hypothetical protein
MRSEQTRITFSAFNPLTKICNIEVTGDFNSTWNGEYDRTRHGKQSYIHPSGLGSGLRIKILAVRRECSSNSDNEVPDATLDPLLTAAQSVDTQRSDTDHPDNFPDQDNLIYIIVSKKYPILYVGITTGGLQEGIFNRGRLKHHLNKLLAICASETSHTVGWNHHTKQRYEDNKIAFGSKVSDVDFRGSVLNDLYISVGTANDQQWEPKKHEGFVLSAAFETLGGYRQQLQILNTGAMSYEPIPMVLPPNLSDFALT